METSDYKRGLTREYLKGILDYNPKSGEFIWRIRRGKARRGSVAGKPHPHGYVVIGIGGYHYLAHRLAWFYTNGVWPSELDHINRIKNDNRISNLRIATRSQNNINAPVRSRSTSGFKGAKLDRRDGKYDACITFNGKSHHLGRFDNPADANRAYQKAAKKLCGEFARSA